MNRKPVGTLLLWIQFGALALQILLTAAALEVVGPPDWALAVGAGGLLLGAWALYANRPGNFNFRPEPREGGVLVTHGPYRWIRHPMYAALLLISAGLGGVIDSFHGWMLSLTLLGALLVKASFEDRWMSEAYPDYSAYLSRTRGFIPFLY
jgi:protein-S-isoprenylcysteine O-methyltransferase Ste14